MTKRGLTVLGIFLILLPLAFASHTATITSNYNPIYETNPVNITLTVDNNLFSSDSINNVNVQNSGFTINGVFPVLGWTLTNNNSIKFFTTTNAISNWGIQRFGFSLLAYNVNQDTTYTWAITTTDTSNGQQTNNLQLQVLNDNTPPQVTGTTPGSFIRGSNSELFSVDANDSETGISNSNLYLSNCDLLPNATSPSYSTISLTCSSGTCSNNQDLASWPEGDVCFYYDVSNRGGETAITNNLTTIIDRTPPSVSLIAPADNSFLNVTSVNLDFNAIDNYDTNLDCNVVVNGNPNPTTGTGNLSYNLAVTDGVYTWSISCTDEVSLVGTSSTNMFTVDNSAPNITLSVLSVNDRGNNVIIDAQITDVGSGVDQNSITAEIIDTNNNITSVTINNGQIIYPTSTSTIPGIYTISVSASDNLGHSTAQQSQFRIRETYSLTVSLSQSQIDASTLNLTNYVTLTGSIVKDDGTIPTGTVDVAEILQNETIAIDFQGDFTAQIEIPQNNGIYTVIASFINGIDTFTANANIAVGPYCGNGIIDNNEQCDGNNLNGQSCSSFGFSQGSLSCTATCTLVTNQCSNPPPKKKSSSGGGSSQVIQIITPAEPVLIDTERTLHSGEVIVKEERPAPTESSGDLVISNTTTTQTQSGFGIGASWAALTNFARGINRNLLLAVAIIGVLLYVFGWRKKEDEWDRYFKRHGQR